MKAGREKGRLRDGRLGLRADSDLGALRLEGPGTLGFVAIEVALRVTITITVALAFAAT